jgi:protein disulfide-isomerase A6
MQKQLAEKNKARPFGWVWTTAGLQRKFEQAFDVGGFGFPAMVAINAKKKKFATLRGAYTKTSVQEFVNRLVG